MIILLALFLNFVCIYAWSISSVTRKTLALWVDRFRDKKGEMSEETVQLIENTLCRSYVVYYRNRIYYSVSAILLCGINVLFTPSLLFFQPLWLVVLATVTNVLIVKWAIVAHKAHNAQMKRIKEIINKYPQTFYTEES